MRLSGRVRWGAAVTVVLVGSAVSAPQAWAATQAPYASAIVPPATIQAEQFDQGGEGTAYHDVEAANLNGAFRPADGVDIQTTTDTGGGWNVSHVRAGEWLEFTLSVPTAATFDVSVRFAGLNKGGTAHLEVNGVNLSGSIALTGTGGWQTWKTVTGAKVALPAGTVVLRLVFDTTTEPGRDIGNVNWIKLATSSAPAPSGPAWPTSWTSSAAAPAKRFEPAGLAVGDKIYVFGGFKDADFRVDRTYASYTPATNTWTSLGTLPAGMAETHVAVATDGKVVWLAGGFAGDIKPNDPRQAISSAVWRYTPSSNSWQRITTLPQPRGAGTLALVGRRLHYISGNPADRVTNVADHYTYDLDTGAWGTAKVFPNPKDHLSSVVLNGKIYVLGGEHGHDELHQQQADAHVYDPATNAWTKLANMPIAKSHLEAATFVSDGHIVMAGGQIANFTPTANVIAYNPATNTWKTLPNLPAARQGAVVQRIGSRVVVTVGGLRTSEPQSTTWRGTLPSA